MGHRPPDRHPPIKACVSRPGGIPPHPLRNGAHPCVRPRPRPLLLRPLVARDRLLHVVARHHVVRHSKEHLLLLQDVALEEVDVLADPGEHLVAARLSPPPAAPRGPAPPPHATPPLPP